MGSSVNASTDFHVSDTEVLIFPINAWNGGLAQPLGGLTREGPGLVVSFPGVQDLGL